jgi:acetyltransferase-like isoleucine patch superfamily enzyme
MGEQVVNAVGCGYEVGADCTVGERTSVGDGACVISGSTIGADCTIGRRAHIEGSAVGDRCVVQAYAYVPAGITLEDDVFVGPHVCFTNDATPTAVHTGEFVPAKTRVKTGAVVGANATIGAGVTIGARAFVAVGAIVLQDVPDGATVHGHAGLCVNYSTLPRVPPKGGPDRRGDDPQHRQLMPGGEV